MDYVMKVKFSADTDDEAKEMLNDTLDETDLCSGGQDTSTGELFYSDGETKVP